MLAYVFWHWPQPGVDHAAYRELLLEFHRILAGNKPDGFHRSIVFQVKGASWLNVGNETYEEWYLLDDSSCLDRINEAAVSGPCEEPHNRVARKAAGGVAGLYRLRRGVENLTNARIALWFSKPFGVSYSEMYSSLEAISSLSGSGLWVRQMTLGPTPEFSLYSPTQVELPNDWAGNPVQLQLAWSE